MDPTLFGSMQPNEMMTAERQGAFLNCTTY
jgi:hypothetical protein